MHIHSCAHYSTLSLYSFVAYSYLISSSTATAMATATSAVVSSGSASSTCKQRMSPDTSSASIRALLLRTKASTQGVEDQIVRRCRAAVEFFWSHSILTLVAICEQLYRYLKQLQQSSACTAIRVHYDMMSVPFIVEQVNTLWSRNVVQLYCVCTWYVGQVTRRIC
jgi:hypothetical protein